MIHNVLFRNNYLYKISLINSPNFIICKSKNLVEINFSNITF